MSHQRRASAQATRRVVAASRPSAREVARCPRSPEGDDLLSFKLAKRVRLIAQNAGDGRPANPHRSVHSLGLRRADHLEASGVSAAFLLRYWILRIISAFLASLLC